jgi:hypothetical protein
MSSHNPQQYTTVSAKEPIMNTEAAFFEHPPMYIAAEPEKLKKNIIPLNNELVKVNTFKRLEELKDYTCYKLIDSKDKTNFQEMYTYAESSYQLLGNYSRKETKKHIPLTTSSFQIYVDMTTLYFTRGHVSGVIDEHYRPYDRPYIVPHNRYQNLDKMIEDIYYNPNSKRPKPRARIGSVYEHPTMYIAANEKPRSRIGSVYEHPIMYTAAKEEPIGGGMSKNKLHKNKHTSKKHKNKLSKKHKNKKFTYKRVISKSKRKL